MLSSHAAIQWDDYEKDYSDLPPQVSLLVSSCCFDRYTKEAASFCVAVVPVVVAPVVAADMSNASNAERLKMCACQTEVCFVLLILTLRFVL